VYVQYTNPAAYPPLEHSSQLLAERGWDVLFLGIESWGSASLRFPDYRGIRVRQLSRRQWRVQKLHYPMFFCWSMARILGNRTSWIYASDMMSCPVALAASLLFRIPLVYHEHDSPARDAAGAFARFCLWTRDACARRAQVCILPNRTRAERLAGESRREQPPLVIWNCPRRPEVGAARSGRPDGVRILYHGTVVPDRVPLEAIDALATLPDAVSLTVIGYETVGSAGYRNTLRQRAVKLGIADRIVFVDPMDRDRLMRECPLYDLGLALVPLHSRDVNFTAMTGASNKPFDYLSCGLALLTSSLPDWEEMFIAPGYGLACDPGSAKSIGAALRWFFDHPQEMRAMGERGRQKILGEWNYEAQFAPVWERLHG
jgi:glycosyltransferase involved in cell wall biosynthesis